MLKNFVSVVVKYTRCTIFCFYLCSIFFKVFPAILPEFFTAFCPNLGGPTALLEVAPLTPSSYAYEHCSRITETAVQTTKTVLQQNLTSCFTCLNYCQNVSGENRSTFDATCNTIHNFHVIS